MSGSFKVLQFNMQFGQPWDDAYPDHVPINLQSTIDEIRCHNADIIMLQEVEHALPGGQQILPPPHYSRLKEEFKGYHSYFSYPKPDIRELPFGIGLAIFSKTPLRDEQSEDLPSPPVEFDFFGEKKTPTDRLLIGVTTNIGGRDVRLFNTHLLAFFMLKSSSEFHLEQRQLVEMQLRGTAHMPTLLTGDFNVSKHHSLIQQFADCGYKTVQSTEITWRRRPYVLDHIFYNDWLRPTSWEVRPTMSSDHHVLTANFEFTR
ncbi:MAG TPA: endonuclease/exonuclease/phosphatase family protein [Lacunisphaera sp.]|nr:endonuclease/exonuclease/phosphatase family protein [Lacunisphaera sp.]